MTKVQPYSLFLILLAITGCSDSGSNSNAKQNDKNAKSNIMETKVTPPPQNDPVEEFREFAKGVVANAQKVAGKYTKPIKLTGSNGIMEMEIDSDYNIDVKKSDSLISPYIGEIKLKRRKTFTGEVNGIKFTKHADPWTPITIECGYQNGKWKEQIDITERLTKE